MPLELLADARCVLGECPLWDPDAGHLLWLDLARAELHVWSPSGGHRQRSVPGPGPLGGLIRVPGGVAVVTGSGVRDPAGALLSPLAPAGGGAHPNDAKVDRAGRLWVATADDEEERPTGRLLRVDGSDTVAVGDPMVVANGPAFSPDGSTVYWSDSMAGRVLAAPIEGGEPHLLLTVPPSDGVPDGLTVSADGSIWVALWGGGAVLRVAPDGRPLERIDVPAPLVTSVTFGGSDCDLLLITTARWELDAAALDRFPHSGGAFAWTGGATGLPESVWSAAEGIARMAP